MTANGKRNNFGLKDWIYITQKHSDNGTEYILEKDGTVKEAGADNKPVVIMEANKEMAENSGKIKAKQSDVPLENKSTWMNIKEKNCRFLEIYDSIGNTANATVKGVAEAALPSVATIAGIKIGYKRVFGIICQNLKQTHLPIFSDIR